MPSANGGHAVRLHQGLELLTVHVRVSLLEDSHRRVCGREWLGHAADREAWVK